MTRDEQRQITEFVESAVTGSPVSPLPSLDVEADAIIRALFVRNPDAAYRMTMLAIAQARELEAQESSAAEAKAEAKIRARKPWVAFLPWRRQSRRRHDPYLGLTPRSR
jgi:hypothetical protein